VSNRLCTESCWPIAFNGVTTNGMRGSFEDLFDPP
jgi:hypothetical protein